MRAYLFNFIIALVIVATSNVSQAAPGDAQFAIAAKHYANQDWQLAADEFDAFVSEHPNHIRADDASFFAAESLVQLHEYAAAAKRFQAFHKAHASHKLRPRVMFRWGECAYLADQPTQALDQLRQFVSEYPDHELTQYALPYLGNACLTIGDRNASITAFSDALKQHPRGSLADECLLQLANIAYQQKKYDEAIHLLNQLQVEFPDSELAVDAIYWLGMAEFDKGRYQQAADEFARITQLADDHEHKSASQYFAAESLRRLGKYEEAAQAFDALTTERQNEWSDDAIVGRMRLALQQKQYEKLDRLAARFQSEHPESSRRVEAQQLHAKSLLKRQLFDQALPVMFSLSRDPSVTGEARAANLYLLAAIYLGTDRPQDALQTLEQIQTDGRDVAFKAQVNLARGTALNSLDRHAEAIRALSEAMTEAKTAVVRNRIRSQLIYGLSQSNQLVKAQEVLRTWADSPDADAKLMQRAIQHIADLAFRLENYQVASRYYAKMLADGQSEEGQLSGLTGLAWCHFRLNNDQDAVLLFERLLEQAPNSVFAQEAQIARARSLQRLNQSDEALTAYVKIVKQPQRDERWAVATLAAAALLESQNKLDDAAGLLELLIRHRELNQHMDQVWYQLGWVQQKRGDTIKAVSAFKRIYLEHADSEYWTDATFRMAEAAFKTDQLDEASKLLARIAQQPRGNSDPRITPFATYLAARIDAEAERWPDVVSSLSRLVSEYPTSPVVPSAEFWLAEAYYRQRDFSNAFPHLLNVANSHTEESAPWHAMVLLRMAQIKATERDWPKVRTLLVELRERFPDFDRNYEVDYLDGRQYAAAGEFAEARGAFQRTINSANGRFTETAAKAQWMIGESYLHQSNYQQALRAYVKTEMVYDYPQWRAAALLQAGKCQERLGRVDEAKKLYERINNELPMTSFHAAAQKRLTQIDVSPSNRTP